jgi:hydrogenase expression/formation protein HypD
MFRFRDKKVFEKVIEKLKDMDLNIRIMHVCGTHQDTLVRFGLEEMLKNVGVEVRQGPGCPVCVTPPREIEELLLLSQTGKTIAIFGDLLHVPGEKHSLADIKTKGGDVKIVYGIGDAVEIAKKSKKDVIFAAIGFETTMPCTASTLFDEPPENFFILNCHRLVPPALKALIELGEIKIHGLIEPGHVSTIIGSKPYEFLSEKYKVPQVIAGFEPLDLMMGIYMLARQIKNKEAKVEIGYKRVVKKEGNQKAQKIMKTVFDSCDIEWRGFSKIPKSGTKPKRKYEQYDARKVFCDELKMLEGKEFKEPKGCKCGEVLRGVIYPTDCSLFGKVCTPDKPIGPCMVSREGCCNILYRYRK